MLGPQAYDAIRNGPSAYLFPAAGSEDSLRMQVQDQLALSLDEKTKKGSYEELYIDLLAFASGVGVFLLVVISTCVAAEVVWWIRDGFIRNRTLEGAPHSEYPLGYVTSVLGHRDEEQGDFEPQIDDYRAWKDPMQDEAVTRSVSM
jgi:hypothetical protein